MQPSELQRIAAPASQRVVSFGRRVATLLVGLSLCASAQAQSEADLARQAQNPVADMVSLPFQNNTNFNAGPRNRTQNVLNIQPVVPVTLNERWNLITRTIVPVTYISSGRSAGDAVLPSGSDFGSKFGLGDATFTAFFSPRDSGKLTWGVGPVVLIPTSTDDVLGVGEWGGGLSAVVLGMPGNWVVGSLFSNVWSATAGDGSKVDLFTWQYFVNYNIPESGGWYLTSAPIITANWEADNEDRWTVPLGGGVGKIFRIGKQPMNAQVAAYYNVDKPRFGADWQLRLQLQFLFPKGR